MCGWLGCSLCTRRRPHSECPLLHCHHPLSSPIRIHDSNRQSPIAHAIAFFMRFVCFAFVCLGAPCSSLFSRFKVLTPNPPPTHRDCHTGTHAHAGGQLSNSTSADSSRQCTTMLCVIEQCCVFNSCGLGRCWRFCHNAANNSLLAIHIVSWIHLVL